MNDTSVRERILDAATRLFGRQGYGATSMRELAEEVGVTKPTLYYWFQSKEGVFEAAMARQVELLRGFIGEVLEGPGTAVERMHAFCDHYVHEGIANPDGLRLFLMALGPLEDCLPEGALVEIHRESLLAVQHLLADGVAEGSVRSELDPTVASLSLVGALNMHILAGLHGVPLPDDLTARILRIFLSGVAAP